LECRWQEDILRYNAPACSATQQVDQENDLGCRKRRWQIGAILASVAKPRSGRHHLNIKAEGSHKAFELAEPLSRHGHIGRAHGRKEGRIEEFARFDLTEFQRQCR
jgi:hypothetical protein